MSLEDRTLWPSKQNQLIMAMQPEQKSSYPCRQRNTHPNINNIHDGSKQMPCIAYNNRMGDYIPVCALRPCAGRVSARSPRGPAARGPPRAGFLYLLRGGAGCGPNDKVAGRVRAQLFQPAQFKFSNNLHIVCAI